MNSLAVPKMTRYIGTATRDEHSNKKGNLIPDGSSKGSQDFLGQ